MANEEVKQGDFVKVNYTGTFEDGNVFDSSEGKDPLAVLAGKGMLIKGFDDALIGMKPGEDKELTIEPEDAYGHHNAELVKEVPRTELGADLKPEVGMVIGIKAPTGQVFPATITRVEDDKIWLDANHPLAGKKLHFKLNVLEAREPTDEDLQLFAQPHEGATCSDGSCDSCESGCEDHHHA